MLVFSPIPTLVLSLIPIPLTVSQVLKVIPVPFEISHYSPLPSFLPPRSPPKWYAASVAWQEPSLARTVGCPPRDNQGSPDHRHALFHWQPTDAAIHSLLVEVSGGVASQDLSPPWLVTWLQCPRYNIRLENLSGDRLQLRERHWRIYSLSGTLETVKGRGVIGQVGKTLRPHDWRLFFSIALWVMSFLFLSPRSPYSLLPSRPSSIAVTFLYNLQADTCGKSRMAISRSIISQFQCILSHYRGTFRLERQDKQMFDVRIPPFTLESHNNTIKNM